MTAKSPLGVEFVSLQMMDLGLCLLFNYFIIISFGNVNLFVIPKVLFQD